MGTLAGKKVFITGAEQGIGRATAEQLIRSGCDIYLHYHSGEEGPKALAELAHSLGQKAAYGYSHIPLSHYIIDKTTTFCTFRQERRYLRYLLIRLNTVHHHKTKVVAKSSVLLI